jgi:hypothetical protein
MYVTFLQPVPVLGILLGPHKPGQTGTVTIRRLIQMRLITGTVNIRRLIQMQLITGTVNVMRLIQMQLITGTVNVSSQ